MATKSLSLLLYLTTLSFATQPENWSLVRYYEQDLCSGFPHIEFGPRDKCLVTKDTRFHSVQFKRPFPTCRDGTESKLATFPAKSGTCASSRHVEMKKLDPDDVPDCIYVQEEGDVGSFAFWCDGAPIIGDERGGYMQFDTGECLNSEEVKPQYVKPDTCVNSKSEEGGFQFLSPALCKNGTKALIAEFRGVDCDPTEDPIEDALSEWDDMLLGYCGPVDGMGSMAFWCDGVEGVDLRKPNPEKVPSTGGVNIVFLIWLSVGLACLFFVVMAFTASFFFNDTFRARVKGLFGRDEGYIAL